MTDDLKRCPFCGGEPKVFYHDTKWFGPTCHIECLDDNCGCGTCHHESAEIAATVWNRRIEAQAVEIEELKSWKAAEDAHHHKLRAEIETLKTMIFATGEAAAVNLRTAMERALEIERLREALTQIARLRTDLSGDFSLGSHQSDIARAALGEGND